MGASLEREVELLKPQHTHCSPSEVIACNRVDRTHPGHDDIMTPQGRQDAPPGSAPSRSTANGSLNHACLHSMVFSPLMSSRAGNSLRQERISA